MRYKLSDLAKQDKSILDMETYKDFSVLVLTGSNVLMQKVVSNLIKESCQSKTNINVDTALLSEFGYDSSAVSISNILDFETFRNNIEIQSLSGKWFCSADMATLTSKQIDWVKEYIKKPSKNGVLVITSTNFKEYKPWLSNKILTVSPEAVLLEMSYPTRYQQYAVANMLFKKRNVEPDARALELFTAKMSSEYDQYEEIIDKVCSDVIPEGYFDTHTVYMLSYDSILDSMRYIQNFVIDDFIYAILKPMEDRKPSGKKQIWRILGYLLDDMGPRKLVASVLYKIEELIQFRIAINTGYIPVAVKGFDVQESKMLLGDENPLTKKSDFMFRRLANTAAMTSLQDLVCIKMMLKNVDLYNEMSYTKALYSMIVRSALNASRLDNDIGVENVILGDLNILDNIPYLEIVDEQSVQ